MVYNIVDGPSKLSLSLLAYLKTKKNDLIATYAKRWTTIVHHLKLIYDRRCATMSFIYCSNVWVINLDRKGYWITESEQKIVHCPIHYVRWGQCGFKTFRPSVREKSFCRILFYFKRKKYVCVNFVLLFVLLFTIIQSILAVARGPQWCLPYTFATMSFTHSFFSIYPWQISRGFF